AGRAVRGAVFGDVAAARRARAAHGDEVAAADTVKTTPPLLAIADLRLNRGARTVLAGVDLGVGRGELVALMGPSGSGKTTILRAVAALETFESGQIVVDGVALTGGGPPAPATLAALRRKVGMVFQFHCLFEHLTALQNVCLAPVHVLRVAAADAERRAH